MFCPQCGTETKPAAKFCHVCRHPLDAAPPPAVAPQAPPPAEQVAPPATSTPTPFDTGAHPWRRFFARTVDLLFLAIPLYAVLVFGLISVLPANAEKIVGILGNPIAAAVLAYLLWLPIEAALLANFGTTPAKWVFGISVLKVNGQKLTFAEALQRAAFVCIYGDGFGVPIIALFTRAYAYDKLKKTGTTKWDTISASVILHSKWGAGRIVGATVVVTVALLSSGILLTISRVQEAKFAAKIEQSQNKKPQASKSSEPADNAKKRTLEVTAKQGDAVAQYELGVIYSIEENYDEAVRLFRLAADQGNLLALHRLGTSYYWGHGVPQDYKEASRLFRVAANQGVASAQYMLAISYQDGKGVPQDQKEYMRYLGLAADQGSSTAFHQLGNEYRVFDPIRRPFTKEELKRNVLAYALYNHSCSIQPAFSATCGSRDQVKIELSDSQLEVGQALTREMAQGKPTQVIARYLKTGSAAK